MYFVYAAYLSDQFVYRNIYPRLIRMSHGVYIQENSRDYLIIYVRLIVRIHANVYSFIVISFELHLP